MCADHRNWHIPIIIVVYSYKNQNFVKNSSSSDNENLVLFWAMEEFQKSVEIWQSYCHEFGGTPFGDTVYISKVLRI